MPTATRRLLIPVILLFPLLGSTVNAYSVLTHEALVDAMWDVKLKPVLLARFPNSTPEELKKAHGFAYGGAIIQDMGYYPHGSEQFSDLTHYVRTGEFILNLIHNAQDLNELAFALGALSHYMGDLDGHRFATNIGEPMLYPDLQKKYGNFIVYEQNPAAHLKTEFGFDVLEVAKGNFAPEAYHEFIGFYVSKTDLQKGFRDTYGLDLQDVFQDFDRAVESYRRAVSKTIPKATRIAWAQKQNDIMRSEPGMTRQKFVYVMSRSSYEKNWGKQYDRPTTGDRILAFLLRLLPPIGPLKALRLKMPTAPVEKLFQDSFVRATGQYHEGLDKVGSASLELDDRNYDVGVVTPAGTYFLEDNIQAYWLKKLAEKNFTTVTPEIKTELVNYYGNLDAPIATKKKKKEWAEVVANLQTLKTAKPVAVNAAGY
ncbi:MAG TPA: zinc dependent phospholipase C family protein [Bryobacteraceae bacterium]|nr:zinc dependent phospholipase C family protein [Bryobacteraceae bacterium]